MTDTATQTTITSNGSTWGGESPQPVETLLARLASHTLDRAFENYGDFVEHLAGGVVIFFGNFIDYSHVFSIETNDPELASNLEAAIEANKCRAEYIAQKAPVSRTRERGSKRLRIFSRTGPETQSG